MFHHTLRIPYNGVRGLLPPQLGLKLSCCVGPLLQSGCWRSWPVVLHNQHILDGLLNFVGTYQAPFEISPLLNFSLFKCLQTIY